MFLEGPRLVKELLNTDQTVDIIVWTPTEEAGPVVRAVQGKAKRMYRVSEPVFALVSDVKSPQGILAIVKRPLWRWDAIVSRTPSPILVLDGVQDPGNLATIVRTAEAAGAAGLITTPGTTRLFSPKALRGAMGSTFRLPCLEHRTPEDIHRELLKASYSLLLASMPSKEKRSTPYTAIDWKRPIALVLGQEGSGSSPAWNALADSCLHIPMRTPVESLNVAAAAAILLYEFVRQNAPLDTP